jgi:glycosyltransferase involved in cell wall biosynthesis
MHIGIFSSSIGFGGAQNTAITTANALRRRGHRVTLYLDARRFRCHKDIKSFALCDLPVNAWCPYGLDSLSFRNLLHCARALDRSSIDIMLSIASQPLPILMLLQARFGFPVAYYEVGRSRTWATRVFRGPIIANSEETEESLRQHRCNSSADIPIVRARIDVDDFLPLVESPSELDASGPISLLMISRIECEKLPAIEKVIRAVSTLLDDGKNVYLTLCGPGKDRDGIADMAALSVARHGPDRITLAAPTSQVAPLIRDSDIVLGVGRTAWEAMACRRPVVIVGREGLGGIVSEKNLPVLMRHNFTARGNGRDEGHKEIAETLQVLIDSPLIRRDLGEYGHDVVRRYYDASIGAAKMETIFCAAVDSEISSSARARVYCLCAGLMVWMQRYARAVVLWFLKRSLVMRSIQKRRELGRGSQAVADPSDH